MTSIYNPERRGVIKKSAGLMGLAALSGTGLSGMAAAQEGQQRKYGIQG